MKQIKLTVITQNKKNALIHLGENNFRILVSAPAKNGQANRAVIKLLKKHFRVKNSQINMIAGEKSRHKIVNIYD